jgi:hypothetical protein
MDNNYLLCIIYRLGLLMSRHVSNSSHLSIIKSLKLLPYQVSNSQEEQGRTLMMK